MLEWQWGRGPRPHPVLFARRHPDGLVYAWLIWAVFGPIAAAAPRPEKMAHWSILRWFSWVGLGCLPWLLLLGLLVTFSACKIFDGLSWLRRNPPVRVRTRWP